MFFSMLASFVVAQNANFGGSISSRQALLDPRVHVGQIMTWFWTVAAYSNPDVCRGPSCESSSHSLLVACSVESRSADETLLTDRIRMFAAGQPPGGTIPFSPVIERSGQLLKADGSTEASAPLCLLYSTDLWGSPPTFIRPGTRWRFKRSNGSPYRGVVTVEAANSRTGEISLHVSSGADHTIDLVIEAGGIIVTEIERWSQQTETDVSTVSLQDRSLARLWNLPQPVPPDILNPNGRIFDMARSSIIPGLYVVRIWHFGPYLFSLPNPPNMSDCLLFVGVVVFVVAIARAELLIVHVPNASALAILRIQPRRLLLEVVFGFAIAAASVWWVHHR